MTPAPVAPVVPLAPLLELDAVDAGYGPFRALFGLSLRIAPGGALALVGANGAGKTTVARVATGLVRPTKGRVRLDGVDIAGLRPFRIARLGVVHAPEGRSVFATLTVEENLVLTARREAGRRGAAPMLARAFELFPQLASRRRQLAGTLSGGEQRMLSLARVMLRPPRLLVVDELSLGLAPIVVDEVYRTLREIRTTGTAMLVIEQQVAHALALADDVAVLARGRVVHAGPVGELEDLGDLLLATRPAGDGSGPAGGRARGDDGGHDGTERHRERGGE